MGESLAVLGAGGQARETVELAQLIGLHVSAYVDRFAAPPIRGVPVIDEENLPAEAALALGVGEPRLRAALHKRFDATSRWSTLVHPAATLSNHAILEAACMVQAGAVISCDVILGVGCLINYGATIGHDAHVGPYVVVLPGAAVSGAARLGAECMIGSRAVVLPGVEVGERAVVGAGAVAVKDVVAGSTVVGVPAAPVKRKGNT